MRRLELALYDGTAELRALPGGDVLWSSDDDPDFLEEYPETLTAADLPHVVDWLLDSELLSEAEADHMDEEGNVVEETDDPDAPFDEDEFEDDWDDEELPEEH